MTTEQVPAWVTADIFREILMQRYADLKEMQQFNVKKALGKGENYITTILRIEIIMKMHDDSLKQIQFILKIPLLHETNAVNEYHDLFISEAAMYETIIPELEAMYERCDQKVKFKPLHLQFTQSVDCDYILMEDLQPYGYANVDRRKGLNESYTKAVLSKLAQWHAASAQRVAMHGDYPKEYRDSYMTHENRALLENMNQAFTKPFLKCMESYKLSEAIRQHIRKYSAELTDNYLQCGHVNASNFNVLNHGDFWLNNIMFQHKDNEIKRIVFVDFQLPKYGSPAQDLFCFLMSSPQFDIKLQKFDEFIAHYHAALLKNLKLLQYQQPMPQLDELHQDLQRNGLWGFIDAQRMLAVALLDPNENSNIETFMSNNAEGVAFKKRMFYNPSYVSQMEAILPWLIERNYLKI